MSRESYQCLVLGPARFAPRMYGACAGDPELRAEVESLLKHDATGILGTESLTEQVRGMFL